MKLENIFRYELFIAIGFLMTLGAVIKILGIYNFPSEWFLALGGVGLFIDGIISLLNKRRFDRKYKIIERKTRKSKE